ncbi:hypothetical protein ACLVWU_06535 [Bdellovibrio sp. HCB290]|uniref:hypothetical protein n=1 Tax=Bdellovibrio sp. HCB290 TaxID=3394356 RepID=UPI0039B3C633
MPILKFLTLFFFMPALTHASLFMSPVGSAEAFLGNAGTALTCSSGSTVYNPAGIGFCQDKVNVSVSGSSIAYQELDGSAFQRETGTLKSGTLLASAILPYNEIIHTGLFYSYPTNTENYVRIENGDGSSVTGEIERQMALAGLAYGGLIHSRLAWGLSVAMSWGETNNEIISNSPAAGTWTTLTEKRIETENYIILKPALLWKAQENYDLGVTAQWRGVNIYAEGELYQNQMSTGQTDKDETFRRYTPHTDNILAITVGQSFRFFSQEVLLDLSYAPEYIDASELYNLSVGWMAPFYANTKWLGGVSYSNMTEHENILITTGFQIQQRTYVGNIGLFFQYLKNKDIGAINSNTIGFLYSSAINY